jgi:DNA repair exonuclease SbcCD ATPase subunit
MRIHLQNICCWQDKVIDFPDNGSVLLSAPSGSGKTSIIRAMMFGFFGTNGAKIMRHDTRTCSVVIEYKNLWVERTKGPVKLIAKVQDSETGITQEYADKGAQGVINKYITNVMYLPQGGKNTFVAMTSADHI